MAGSKKSEPAKVGRPPTRPQPTDDGILDIICQRLIGGESIIQICSDPSMPVQSQFYLAMAKDERFRRVIEEARISQQEALIDETVDMADAATPENYQVVKLRIWARQWRAGKLAPKKYGEKIQQEHTGTLTLEQLVTSSLKSASDA